MAIYWGDYMRDTGHLNATEHGAYFMLIKHYWCTGKPIKNNDDELWRLSCCDSKKQWTKIKHTILTFFTQVDGFLVHKRIEAELAIARSKAVERRESGKRGAAVRWPNGHSSMAEPNGNGWQDD